MDKVPILIDCCSNEKYLGVSRFEQLPSVYSQQSRGDPNTALKQFKSGQGGTPLKRLPGHSKPEAAVWATATAVKVAKLQGTRAQICHQ